jgi:hypothetical protein
MNQQATTYTLSEHLLQAVVSTLNELPAGRVRPLLNAIEGECVQQDKARADQARADADAAQQATWRRQLEDEGWLAPDVQTPAPERPLPGLEGSKP